MKKFLLLLSFVITTLSISAQAPDAFNYQAVVRDNSGNIITNHDVKFQINILQGAVDGTAVYSETHAVQTNGQGLVNMVIGTGTTAGDMSTINWGNDSYYIQINLDINGGENYELMGTSQLLSVPYALHAKTADSVSETKNLTQTLAQGNDGGAVQIKNIADPTEAQDAVTKAYVDLLISRIEELESLVFVKESVTDIDGNEYKTVKIGGQVWMAENLRVEHFPDGTEIPLVTDNTLWANLGDNDLDKAYCYSNNNQPSSFGALYTYAAAVNGTPHDGTNNVQGACPDGWHVPSDAEWSALMNYLIENGYNYDGTTADNKIGKALASLTEWWESAEVGDVGNDMNTNNTSGFNAFPDDYRLHHNGTFPNNGMTTHWWSSTSSGANAINYALFYSYAELFRYALPKSRGFSVRCVKD